MRQLLGNRRTVDVLLDFMVLLGILNHILKAWDLLIVTAILLELLILLDSC